MKKYLLKIKISMFQALLRLRGKMIDYHQHKFQELRKTKFSKAIRHHDIATNLLLNRHWLSKLIEKVK